MLNIQIHCLSKKFSLSKVKEGNVEHPNSPNSLPMEKKITFEAFANNFSSDMITRGNGPIPTLIDEVGFFQI
jgi:hypothetical protein